MWTYNYAHESRLCHHGILGMKWGKKNGPPYPLSGPNHSASEKKAGWRKSLDKTDSDGDNKRRRLSDNQKRAIKIGAAAVGIALAAYGGYRLYESGTLDRFINKGANTLSKVEGLETDSSTGFKFLKSRETFRQAASKVNPTGSRTNCRACAIANVLRMRGFDVVAKDIPGGTIDDAIDSCFKNAKKVSIFSPSASRVTKQILNRYGEGASGILSAEFKNSRYATTSAHAINWIVKNSSVVFFDGQNSAYTSDALANAISEAGEAVIARLDDAEISIDGIEKFVKNA